MTMISFPIISFKNFQNNNKIQNNAASLRDFTSASNLMPLQKDTVSFSGRHTKTSNNVEKANGKINLRLQTRASKDLKLKSDMGSMKVAMHILEDENVLAAYDRFKADMQSIFGVEVVDFSDKKSHQEHKERYREILKKNIKDGNPVLAITARKKEASSIKEKMGSKQITTQKEAKQKITDIIGVRITLSGTSKNSGNYVVEKLTKAVEEGKIKIIEIENYRNPEFKYPTKYQYASDASLGRLMKASINKGVKNFKYDIRQTESGYTAIHMLLEFPGGIKGELQIAGLDVFGLKDVEDLCFKALTNKALSKDYKEVAKLFEPIKADPDKYREFMAYTRSAYAYERARDEHPLEEKISFLELPEESTLDERYDFNNIAKVKKQIDESIKLEKQAKRAKLTNGTITG